jgi:hypothetical protein
MYLRDPANNLIEVDYPSIKELAPDVRADMKRLSEGRPQDTENLKASLFLGDVVTPPSAIDLKTPEVRDGNQAAT